MDPITVFTIVILFVLGSVVGSFLNVVIYRLPRGESIVYPGSHCPRCGRALTAADLVPLLSWLLLRGRCRSCAARISARYFGVEMLTALLFVGAFHSEHFSIQGDPASLPFHLASVAHKLILVCLFVPIIFIDQDHRIVPDELSVPLLLVGFAWNVVSGLMGQPWLVSIVTHKEPGLFSLSLPTSLVFAMVCAGVFWLIQWFGEIIFRKEAMGLGDVNIAAGVGANFALLDAFCSFGIAISVGALIGVVLILLRKRDRTDQLAFGPMLLTGALVMMLIPDKIHRLVEMYRATLGGG